MTPDTPKTLSWKGKSKKPPEIPARDEKKEMPNAAKKGRNGEHSIMDVGKVMLHSLGVAVHEDIYDDLCAKYGLSFYF